MKKKIIIFIIIVAIISAIILVLKKQTGSKENIQEPVDYTNTTTETASEEDIQKIEEITEDQNFDGNTEIYEIKQEYDGREVVSVKANIQYQVVLAGIINNKQPEFSEIDEILKKAPKYTGIWIEKSSRQQFLQILKGITKSNYTIDEDGYLVQEEVITSNKYDRKIKQMLEARHLYVIDISSNCYIVDEVTGEILNYPFEEMDPYIPFEYFESDKKSIFVITTNSLQKQNYSDIIKEILENIII